MKKSVCFIVSAFLIANCAVTSVSAQSLTTDLDTAKQLYMEELKLKAYEEYRSSSIEKVNAYAAKSVKSELKQIKQKEKAALLKQKKEEEKKKALQKKKKEKQAKALAVGTTYVGSSKKKTVDVDYKKEGSALLATKLTDKDYKEVSVSLSAEDRRVLESLVYGEAGNQGFIGCCLVAQAIKDTMIMTGNYSVQSIISAFKYSGRTDIGTNNNATRAVKYVFDQGGYAVKHRIIYFYAPSVVKSEFHESQLFIVEYKDHRFFDRRE